MLLPRNLKPVILEATKDTPVILVNGARQTGKSTLIRHLFPPDQRPDYFSFDDLARLSAARSGPQSFVDALPERVVLDEIQRVPELFLPIKLSVDQNRKPGRFLITGSADVLSLPKIADSLAGRIEVHTIWPLSQGEIRGRLENFIDAAFSDKSLPTVKPTTITEVIRYATTGGYPDVIRRDDPHRRASWYDGYITSLMERDVRDLANIDQLIALPNLLQLLASRAGALLNNADISRSLQLNVSTLRRYLGLLELLFLVVPLRPWYRNVGKRLVKSPKIYLNDTGLLCHLLSCNEKALSTNPTLFGGVFENFVLMELIKQLGWSKTRAKIYHYRTVSGQEVDIVLEAADGRIVGIECKSSSSVSADTFKGMHSLKEDAGKKFHRGIVLYIGTSTVSFSKQFQAVPASALWELFSASKNPRTALEE